MSSRSAGPRASPPRRGRSHAAQTVLVMDSVELPRSRRGGAAARRQACNTVVAVQSRRSSGVSGVKLLLQTRTVLSAEAETMRLPSGLSEPQERCRRAPGARGARPEPSAFHMRTVLSADAETMRLPSGLHVADSTGVVAPEHERARPEPSAFHTRTVLSSTPRRCACLGALRAARTAPSPRSTRGWPSPSVFHTRTVLPTDKTRR